MGNNHPDLTETEFRQQWRLSEQANGLSIWEHKKSPQYKVEQYVISDDPLENNQKLSVLRKTSPFIVKAFGLKKDGFSCRMDNNSKKLFVQRTVLRLSRLQDIPYPDILHLYDVCIHGYKQLTQIVGFFGVDEDQIGIYQAGQARVWLNTQFNSNKVVTGKVTQSKMVSDILEMLRQIADNDSCGKLPNIHWYIGNHNNITFAEVKQKFQQYVRTYCQGWVPTSLKCINEVGLSKIQNQFSQANAGGGIITNIAPGATYINKTTNQSAPVSNTNFTNPPIPSQTNIQQNLPSIQTKVAQTYPSSKVILPPVQQPTGNFEIINTGYRPPNPQTQTIITSIPTQPNPPVAFINRPTTSFNLVRTPSQNFATQGFNQLSQKPATFNSQVKFASNNVIALPPPTQVIQQIPIQSNQRPLTSQTISQVPSQIPPAGFRQLSTQPVSVSQQPQSVILGNATSAVSQSPIPTYNKPLQVVESITYNNQQREDNRLQQQRVISQTIELKDVGKVAEIETNNNSSSANNYTNNYQTKALKGSQTLDWEDYTNKQKSNTKGLSTFGRSVPYSLDVAADKKVQNQLQTKKFTPESDGKSSPEFLALLTQIKSGIGQTNSYSDNYSYSPSKFEGTGSYGTGSAFQESKFTTSNYVSSKYQGGLDPQLHADLQKYKQ